MARNHQYRFSICMYFTLCGHAHASAANQAAGLRANGKLGEKSTDTRHEDNAEAIHTDAPYDGKSEKASDDSDKSPNRAGVKDEAAETRSQTHNGPTAVEASISSRDDKSEPNDKKEKKAMNVEKIKTTVLRAIDSNRAMYYGVAIAATLFLGFFWYRRVSNHASFLIGLTLLFACLHAVAQFLPWIATWTPLIFFSQFEAGCDYGMPWEWHLAYTVVLVAATPYLSGKAFTTTDGRIPILGLGGTPFQMYAYLTTILTAYDQYSDCASSVLAYSCGWDKAWLMVAILSSSFTIQAVSAFILSGFDPFSLLDALMGSNMEVVALSGVQSDIRASAALGVVKLVTEIVPQSVLAIMFAFEVKPNKFIWVSVGLSLAMGINAFAKGVGYFYPSQEASNAME